MKYIHILIFAMLPVLTSCKNPNRIKFYGKTVTVDYPERVKTLTNGRVLELEGEYTGLMFAYDGILVFQSDQHSDGQLYMYDAEIGKRINAICKTGNGPNEILYFIFNEIFEKDSAGFHVWISANNNGRLIKVNMQGEFVEDVNTAKFESTNEYGIGHFSFLSDTSIIAYMQGNALFEEGPQCLAPSYRVFNFQTGEIIHDYKFYSDYTAGTADRNILQMWPEYYLSAHHGIKPDKSKFAMAMRYIGRLNILDLESGKVKSIETKDAPDLDLILESKLIGKYYEDLRCDDSYIYVLESDPAKRLELNSASGRIFVYDWDGNFKHILRVNEDVVFFCIRSHS